MELGELEYETRLRNRRNAWRIHGVVLLVWTALYLYAFGDKLGARGLSGIGPFVFGVMLLGYAALTTLVIAILGRRPLVPLVTHGLALAAAVTWVVVATQEQESAAAAEARPRTEQRERPQSCVRVRGVEVSEGTPLRAVVRLANACDDAVTVTQVTVAGESPDGDLLLSGAPREPTVPRSESTRVDVTTSDGRGATNTTKWSWAVFVELAAPSSANCYATVNSPRRDTCAMMGPVEPAPP